MSGPATLSRRALLTGGPERPAFRPRPPGVSEATISNCTGCAACVEACPEGILVLRSGRVAVDFRRGDCTFCGACAEACPEPVFTGTVRMAHEAAIGGACLARQGVSCMTCRDACPEEAIAFTPRIGGPFLPALDTGRCTGCGACISACPAQAITAQRKDVADA